MKKFSYIVIILGLLTIAVSACSNSQVPKENIGNPIYKPDAVFVLADAISTQGITDAENDPNVKVGHIHKFSNGEEVYYVTIDGLVIESDMVLGTQEEFEKSFLEYEAILKEGINTQGAMQKSQCAVSALFWCVVWSVGGKWTNSTVYYEPISGFSSEDTATILDVINDYNIQTDLTFVESATAGNRIYFNNSSGCNSRLGMVGGRQAINLGSGCNYKRVIKHEIGHAIGMMHEHQRADRDSYITINVSNLKDIEWWRFFWKGIAASQILAKSSWWQMDQHSSYDYDSIMHYQAYDYPSGWLIDNSKPAFFIKYPNQAHTVNDIGRHSEFSTKDIETINKRY